MDFRVTPNLSSRSAVYASPGCPGSCIYGWVVMTPRLALNFASSAEPRMNLRIQSGLAHSRQALVCVLNLNPRSAAGKPAANRQFHCLPHRPACQELRSNSLQGHQLIWSVDLVELWKQVQKND